MGENISIQEKITVWLKKHPEYRTKAEDEIISAMLSAEDNNLTLNELQELSLFANAALPPEIAGLDFEKSPASPQPFTPTEEEETNLLQVLEERVRSTETKTEGEKEKNGFIGKAWSFLKNTKLLDWCTDSTNDIKKAREDELKLLQTGNVSQIFKNITGVEYTKENVEKFLNGEIKTKSEQALDAYTEGQEMAVDVVGDLVSGIAAVGIYTAAVAAAPFTAGASIALGAGLATLSGGLIKSGVKALDAVTGGREYDTFSKDFATGSFSGLLAPVTAGLGGAIGKVTAKSLGVQAVKTLGKEGFETASEAGLKTIAKNALLNPAGYEYKGGTLIARGAAQASEMAADGALGGGIDSAFRAGIEGDDISDAFISGLAGGAILSPVIGGGFKAAGKAGNKVGHLFKDKNSNLPANITNNTDNAIPAFKDINSAQDVNVEGQHLLPAKIENENSPVNVFLNTVKERISEQDLNDILPELTDKNCTILNRLLSGEIYINDVQYSNFIKDILSKIKTDTQLDTFSKYLDQIDFQNTSRPDILLAARVCNQKEKLLEELIKHDMFRSNDISHLRELFFKISQNTNLEPLYKFLDSAEAKSSIMSDSLKKQIIVFYKTLLENSKEYTIDVQEKILNYAEANFDKFEHLTYVMNVHYKSPNKVLFAMENNFDILSKYTNEIADDSAGLNDLKILGDKLNKYIKKWNIPLSRIDKANLQILESIDKINSSYDYDVIGAKDVYDLMRISYAKNFDENLDADKALDLFIKDRKLICSPSILASYLAAEQGGCAAKSVIDYLAAKKQAGVFYQNSSADLYEKTFEKYYKDNETFGCKTFFEFEEYLKTCTNKAEAGKLLGKIKKETIDNFMSGIPEEIKSVLKNKKGTFTAKDFDRLLENISSDEKLSLIWSDIANGETISDEVREFAVYNLLNDKDMSYIWNKLRGENLTADFQKKYSESEKFIDLFKEKAKSTMLNNIDTETVFSQENIAQMVFQIIKAENVIGRGNLSILLHDESVTKFAQDIYNILELYSTPYVDIWKKIFHTKGLKDNEVKQLIALTSFSSDEFLKIVEQCTSNGVLNVHKVIDEIQLTIGKYIGGKYENIAPDFSGWDTTYLPYVFSILKPENLSRSDNMMLRDLLTAALDNKYKEFLFNPDLPNGVLNLQTRQKFKDAGLDFNQWMEYDGVRNFTFKTHAPSIEPVVKSLNSDLNIICSNNKLQTLLANYIKNCDVGYDGHALYSKNGGKIKTADLLEFTKQLVLFSKECGIQLKNENLLDIKDHFAARLKTLREYNSTLDSEELSISLWKRDTKRDLFQGHYCQCCISLDGCNKQAIIHSLSHVVDNIIELKNSSGETIGKAKVLWMTDNMTDEPVLLVNGFEITGNKSHNNLVREEFVKYMKDYTRAVAGKDVPIVTGRTYQKINYDDLPEFTSNINLIGTFPDNTYHLDSFFEAEGSWPKNLDRDKNLTTRVLYMPENYNLKISHINNSIREDFTNITDILKDIPGLKNVKEFDINKFMDSTTEYTYREREILEDNLKILLKKLKDLDNPEEKRIQIKLAFDILTDVNTKSKVNHFANMLGDNTLNNSKENTSIIAKLFDLDTEPEETGHGMWRIPQSENSIYGRINGRGKSVSSIESKLVKEILDLEVKDLTDATLTNLVKDSYGFRVIPGPVQRADIDVKTILRNAAQTHKDQFGDSSIPLEDALSDFYTNGFNGAIWKQLSDKQRLAVRDIAIENRSDAFVDKIIELVSAGKIDISKISNYSTSLDEKLPYFTANQLYQISDAVEARTGKKIPIVSYDGDDFIRKGSTRDSGYTAGQMNLNVVGSDDLMELQFRDAEVDVFAELEHVPYDIQENKLTVRGSKYDAHRKVLNNLDTAGQKLYEKYRSDIYTYYRLKALGVKNCTKPDIVQMFEEAIKRGGKVFKKDYITTAERNRQLNLISENGLKELHET